MEVFHGHNYVAAEGLRRLSMMRGMTVSMPISVPAAAPSTLHLMGHFTEVFTGAERELLDIRRLIADRRPVKIWSDAPPHPAYAGQGITTIQPFSQQFPNGGALLVAGVHMRPGIWLKYARFERVILFYNLASHAQLFAVIENLREATGLEPELVFVSRMLQLSVGLPGTVIPSLMDLRPFLAVADKRFETTPVERPFTVGRVSRDTLDKHHPEDLALYRMLASRGIRVRIMGGTCLGPALSGTDGIELLPAGAELVAEFYASLDTFFYRTGTSAEAYGRVVLEAMACGLPVVAHVRGGYAEVMQVGGSGVLFESQEQAYDALMKLRNSTDLRIQMGRAARHQAALLHGADATERDLGFYLR